MNKSFENYDAWKTNVPDPDEEPRPRPEPDEPEPPEDQQEVVYVGTCLRWNPLTGRAEQGVFTAYPADYLYDPLRGDT